LTVGETENQYDFRRRALLEAAIQVQRETYRTVDQQLPWRFANKFAPPIASNVENEYQLGWIKDAAGKNPASDKNKDGVINNEVTPRSKDKKSEWQNVQGKKFTYRLGENEVDELIKMVFGLSR
jgi:hypothetical protein